MNNKSKIFLIIINLINKIKKIKKIKFKYPKILEMNINNKLINQKKN